MEINGNGYRVALEGHTGTIIMEGELRLGSPEAYVPIINLMMTLRDSGPRRITLDVRALKALDSAGINTLYKFGQTTRGTELVARGSKSTAWQGTVLPRLGMFNNSFELILE